MVILILALIGRKKNVISVTDFHRPYAQNDNPKDFFKTPQNTPRYLEPQIHGGRVEEADVGWHT